MREVWKPIYETLEADEDLVALLNHTVSSPKIVKESQPYFPSLPYLVFYVDVEEPLEFDLPEIRRISIRISCLASDEKVCEEITELVITALNRKHLSGTDRIVYWCYVEGPSPFPLSYEMERWRRDEVFILAVSKKGA